MKAAALAFIAGLFLALSSSLAGPAIAQEAPKAPAEMGPQAPAQTPPQANSQKDPAPPPSGRYTFVPAEEGYLRLDGTTGQVSFCSQRAAGWACQLVPDERAALDSEIARLQDEVVRLKAEAAKPEPPRPQAELAPPSPDSESRLKLPSREEMEKAKAAFERAWRHFVDMVYDFQKDMTKKE